MQNCIGRYGKCNYASSDGNNTYREIGRHRSIVHNASRWVMKSGVEASFPSLAWSLRCG